MSSHLTGLNNSAAELAGGSLGLGQPLAVRRGRGGGFAGGPLVATGLRSGRLVLERIDLGLQLGCRVLGPGASFGVVAPPAFLFGIRNRLLDRLQSEIQRTDRVPRNLADRGPLLQQRAIGRSGDRKST